ncbi:AAA family ATPase, partial [Streptomyces fulvissimus]|nr:AAA family ATPase [Streptomyces microflavus]
ADPALTARDERHFAAVSAALAHSAAELTASLHTALRSPGGAGRAAMDRDTEVHRLTARLRTLNRFGLDLCLGHFVREDDPEPVYIGRLGLTDGD